MIMGLVIMRCHWMTRSLLSARSSITWRKSFAALQKVLGSLVEIVISLKISYFSMASKMVVTIGFKDPNGRE